MRNELYVSNLGSFEFREKNDLSRWGLKVIDYDDFELFVNDQELRLNTKELQELVHQLQTVLDKTTKVVYDLNTTNVDDVQE